MHGLNDLQKFKPQLTLAASDTSTNLLSVTNGTLPKCGGELRLPEPESFFAVHADRSEPWPVEPPHATGRGVLFRGWLRLANLLRKGRAASATGRRSNGGG